jgi:hypothetical protein
VVAGDEEYSVGGVQLSNRLGVPAELGDAPLGQVSGDGDEVRLECVGPRHHLHEPTSPVDEIQVDVREVEDREAVHGPGEPSQGDVQPFDR